MAEHPPTTPPCQRHVLRSRTPPRTRGEQILRKLAGGPGKHLEDLYVGRLSSYRLLDIEAYLKEFCPDREVPRNIVVLGCGARSELEAVCQHFKCPVSTGLAIDTCDWSAHVNEPMRFRQLDLRGDKEEILELTRDEVMFPSDVRLLVIASCIAVSHYGDLMRDYLAELPPHADILLLEPLCGRGLDVDADRHVNSLDREWQGFVRRGGPHNLARFYTRWELSGTATDTLAEHS